MKISSRRKGSRRPDSFSLIEMLTVITIIAILAGLTIAAFSGVQRTALRNRARNEIGAISGALENYKADNGGYPIPSVATFNSTNDYKTAFPNLVGQTYQLSSELLYQCLTGQTNALSTPPTGASGVRSYFTFKSNQRGTDTVTAGSPYYLQDPFGNSYGYFSGNAANVPVNGSNQYDLWSTAGDTGATNMPGWVTDWAN